MYTRRSYNQLRKIKDDNIDLETIYVDYTPHSHYPDDHYLLSIWYFDSSKEEKGMQSMDFTSLSNLMRALHFLLRINIKGGEQ